MNINLNDKKIKKIVYAIDDISEMDIFFEDGEITSLNRRYLSAMKPDTFLSSMMDSSKKLGKAIIERNKKYGQAPTKKDEDKKVKDSISNLFTAKKLIEMDQDGKIDEIVKAYDKYVWENKEMSFNEYLTKCEQESNNGEESLKRFEDSLDKMNMWPALDKLEKENDIKKEQPKLNKVSSEDIEKLRKCTKEKCDKCDDKCCHKDVESIKISESLDECQKAMESLVENRDKDKELNLRTKNEFITKILIELDKLGFYDLNDKERKKKKDEYIEIATNIAKEREKENGNL